MKYYTCLAIHGPRSGDLLPEGVDILLLTSCVAVGDDGMVRLVRQNLDSDGDVGSLLLLAGEAAGGRHQSAPAGLGPDGVDPALDDVEGAEPAVVDGPVEAASFVRLGFEQKGVIFKVPGERRQKKMM